MILNELYCRLELKGFKEVKIKEIKEMGFNYFRDKKNKIGVLVKNVILKEEIATALDKSSVLRGILLNINANIWNIYLLICFQKQQLIDVEEAYLIEREEKGFRKYVVLNLNDIDRIPFLDNSPSESMADILSIKEDKNFEDTFGRLFIDFLDNNDAYNKQIESKKLQIIIDNVAHILEEKYEIR